MSGISHGSRLEQLLRLEQQVRHEIAVERRRVALEGPAREVPRTPRRLVDVNRVDVRLVELGVTARQVKEWAVAAGLLDRVRRGRVGADLVEAYAAAARSRLAECIEEAYA